MRFPVEEKLSEISAHLAAGSDVVLTSPPGSGKTTCVPLALLNSPWLEGKKILMLEPRRLAAKNCAHYMASKLGESAGQRVGYRVRLERKVSKETQIEIVTEALLTQRLLNDPELSDTGLVIFDEFHERSIHTDLAFALTLEMKRVFRPELRILVMSATLDAEEVNVQLKGRLVHAEGSMFPVETRYLGNITIASAVKKALEETKGDILVFLPGEGEIRRVAETLGDLDNADVMMLYGQLAREEQERVFNPSSNRKVILATSIAETSLTLPGIKCVIDSGLMRVSRFSAATGMSALMTLPLSLDRAEQRRGRAGRVSDGVCYRLWTQADERSRPRKMSPEIIDADLSSLVLSCVQWGALKRCDLPWLTPPPSAAWDSACELLKRLGALDKQGALTEKGSKMSMMPMHPRLANMLMTKDERAAQLAAIIEEPTTDRQTNIKYVQLKGRAQRLADMFLHHCSSESSGLSDGALLSLAYPERIAKNRGNGTFCMVSGRGAFIEKDDPLAKEEFLVCCKLDARQADAKIFLACPIGEKEVERLYASEMTTESLCVWDKRNDRVKAVEVRKLGELVFDEKPSLDFDAASAMIEGVRIKGVENLPCWTVHNIRLRQRINFLWQLATDEAILDAMGDFTSSMTKWRDLENLNMPSLLSSIVLEAGHTMHELDLFAPERIEMPTGSKIAVDYSSAEPNIEVRLQECFGMKQNPTVLQGSIKVVLTLLSPAGRPCATTKDISNFWKEGYLLVRKDLRGRYPKHYWPLDGASAMPTARVRPKGVE